MDGIGFGAMLGYKVSLATIHGVIICFRISLLFIFYYFRFITISLSVQLDVGSYNNGRLSAMMMIVPSVVNLNLDCIFWCVWKKR